MSYRYVCIVTEAPSDAHSLGLLISLGGHPVAVFADTGALLAFEELSGCCVVVSDFKNGGAVERNLARQLFEKHPELPIYVIANGIFTRGALLSEPGNVIEIFDSPYQPDTLMKALETTCLCEEA